MNETKLSLAADVGWLRLAIEWAKRQPIDSVLPLGGPSLGHELEAARERFIDRLKDQERFKTTLMEQSR